MFQKLTNTQIPEGVTLVVTPKHRFKNFDEARSWAKENIVGIHQNEDTKESVCIAKNTIGKYLSASAVLKSIDKDIHLSALMQLPKLIKTAVLKERQKDKHNNPDIKEIQRFYGAILYENNVYFVKITVKAYPVWQYKAYSYEVLK